MVYRLRRADMVYSQLNMLFGKDAKEFVNRHELGLVDKYVKLSALIDMELMDEPKQFSINTVPSDMSLGDMYAIRNDVMGLLHLVEDTEQIGEHDSFYDLAVSILNNITQPVVELGHLLMHIANLIEGGPFRYFVSESMRTYYVLLSNEEKVELMSCKDSMELSICFTDIMRRD